MEDSILTSIKILLGVGEECTKFDTNIIIHINSAFMVLTQLGVGPPTGFRITDAGTTWSSFTGDRLDLESVKDYVHLKTRLTFDPPQSGFLVDAIKEQIKEYEWRLNFQMEGGN